MSQSSVVASVATATTVLLGVNWFITSCTCYRSLHNAGSDPRRRVQTLAGCNDSYLDLCTFAISLAILTLYHQSTRVSPAGKSPNQLIDAGQSAATTRRQEQEKGRSQEPVDNLQHKKTKAKSKSKARSVSKKSKSASDIELPSRENSATLPTAAPATQSHFSSSGGDLRLFVEAAEGAMAQLNSAINQTDKGWQKTGTKSGVDVFVKEENGKRKKTYTHTYQHHADAALIVLARYDLFYGWGTYRRSVSLLTGIFILHTY